MLGPLLGLASPAALVLLLQAVVVRWRHPRSAWLFCTGAAAAFLALVSERVAWGWFNPLLPPEWALVIRAFLMIALVEELAKLGLIQAQRTGQAAPSWPRFAMAAAWIGAGFAGAENCLYILRHGPEVMWMRTFTATPFHVLNAVLAASLLWRAPVRRSAALMAAALAVSVLLHGLYDYLIFIGEGAGGRFWFVLALTASAAISVLRQPDGEWGR